MQIPLMQQLSSNFVERNAFLHVVLGGVVLADQLDSWLQVELQVGATTTASPAVSPLLLDILLGLVAVQRAFKAQVEGCLAEATAPERAGSIPINPRAVGSLLR